MFAEDYDEPIKEAPEAPEVAEIPTDIVEEENDDDDDDDVDDDESYMREVKLV